MHNVPFQPLVAHWFNEHFGHPTPPQASGWQHISTGVNTLIAAPTGSGKTLAAFLWSIDRLVTHGLSGSLADRVYVVYVSPLKALGNEPQMQDCSCPKFARRCVLVIPPRANGKPWCAGPRIS